MSTNGDLGGRNGNEALWLKLIAEAAEGFVFKPVSPGDIFVGPGATIDSLDFLNFLVRLESLAAKRLGKFQPILEEKVLERILKEAHQINDLARLLASL